jgi:hypothetical protein
MLGFIKLSNTGSGTVEVHWDALNDLFAWELPRFECDPRGPAYPNQTAEGE